MITATDIIEQLQSVASQEKKEILQRFFKTDTGEYGYGDIFLGVTAPQNRKIAKANQAISLEEVVNLLNSPLHEARLIALYFLIDKYKKGSQEEKKIIFECYLSHTNRINNWDLVDTSAEHIVGAFLEERPKDILYTLAKSEILWERRIAIIATFAFIKKGDYRHTLTLSDILLGDKHDLMHKAVGWMLREVGKRCNSQVLEAYLEKNSHAMSRTTLRYAIEKLPEPQRVYFLKKDR